jgi:DNA-binding GntR family transcriptional regulator
VREVLEAMAARLAAARISEDELARIEAELHVQAEIVARGDLVAYSRSDFELHGVVYEACGNPYLREMLGRIKTQMRPLRLRIEPVLGMLYEDHRRLAAALRDRDPDRAEEAFRRHNRNVMELIQTQIDSESKLDTG